MPFNVTGGSVDVKAGALSLLGGGTDSGGSITVETGAELDLGGALSMDATSSIAGPGIVKFIGSSNPSTIGGTYDVTGKTETQSAGTINFTGTVQSFGDSLLLDGGTLNFNSPFSGTTGTIPNVSIVFGTANFGANALNVTTLDLNGGTLQSTALINVSGMTTLSSGTISGSGNVNANGGTLINPMNNVVRIDGRTFNNPVSQTVTWTGTNSNIQEYDGAVFNNQGTFLAENDGQFSLGTGAQSSFVNSGSFTKETDAANLVFANVPFNVTGGSVDVKAGDLALDSGSTFTGNAVANAEAGATLEFGGLLNVDSTSQIAGAGTVHFVSSASLSTIAGGYDVTGTTSTQSAGTVIFTGTVTSVGTTFLLQGGTLNFNSPFSGSAGTIGDASIQFGTVNFGSNAVGFTTLTVSGGTLQSSADISVGGLTTLSGGTIAGSGHVYCQGGMTIDPIQNELTFDGRDVENSVGQTATWSGANSNIQLSDGEIFDNLGTFIAENQGTINAGTGAIPTFDNQGQFIRSTDSSELDLNGVSFDSSGGTVDIQTGKLGLLNGGTETSSAFTIEANTTLFLGGSSPFTLDSSTSFAGAGTLITESTVNITYPGNSPSFTGPTLVKAAGLTVDGSLPASPITVSSGCELGGSGTIDSVSITAGTLSPGDGSGNLTANGDVTLNSQSAYVMYIDGPNPGNGFNQLNVTGSVNLGGSQFMPHLGFTPTIGESFPIIESSAPITGTFNGLPEGASLTIGGVPFTISYAGNGGKEVLLTQAGTLTATNTTLTSSLNPSVAGQQVTFTAVVTPTSGTNTPTGTVTFSIDGTTQSPVQLQVVGGKDEATIAISTLSVGSHNITSSYSGDSTFASTRSRHHLLKLSTRSRRPPRSPPRSIHRRSGNRLHSPRSLRRPQARWLRLGR